MEVNLFASEADGLTNPLAIRWDTAGRAYVTVTTTYPHVFPGDVPNDKIIVLEDADRDGVAESSVVFAEGLNIPTAMELGDGGVYVGQSSEILFLRDNDGDGRADTRRVLLSGFGTGDTHQAVNSFIWSPGGELYMGRATASSRESKLPGAPPICTSPGSSACVRGCCRCTLFCTTSWAPAIPGAWRSVNGGRSSASTARAG